MPPGHDAWVVGEEPFVAIDSRGSTVLRGAAGGHDRRVLGTILFTDIVGSTATAARVGDAAWRGLLGELNEATRADLDRYRGREVQTTGDGILAVFDSPERAVRCAFALGRSARELGLEIRAGLHTGEYEPVGTEMRGIAVHVAARVMATAGPGEVRVSGATAALLDPAAFTLEALGAAGAQGRAGDDRSCHAVRT